jgi:hypothetical protein
LLPKLQELDDTGAETKNGDGGKTNPTSEAAEEKLFSLRVLSPAESREHRLVDGRTHDATRAVDIRNPYLAPLLHK